MGLHSQCVEMYSKLAQVISRLSTKGLSVRWVGLSWLDWT
jgi:hypothetical protein